MLETIFVLLFNFLFGISFGSFFNVVIYRTLNEKSLTKRSFCPSCGQILKFYDLIPLASYLLLKGKCRNCKKPISFGYPLIEFLSGLGLVLITYFLLVQNNFAFNANLIFEILIVFFSLAAIIIIAYLDYLTGLIFDSVLVPAILLILGLKIVQIIVNLTERYMSLKTNEFGNYLLQAGLLTNLVKFEITDFFWLIVSGLICAAFFLVLIILTLGKGIGFGDVKFGFLIGLFLGLTKMVVALFSTFFAGAIISIILIALGKKKFGQTIPLGPFLALGTLVSFLFGSQILRFYLSILG